MSSPTVSVIIPTYNSATFIEEAIGSVFAQTYRDFEVIVVDDGSTDDTRRRVAAFGSHVRYFYQPNTGLSAARNTGVRHSRGAYLAFLDADDELTPAAFETEVAVLDARPGVDVVVGAWTYMDASGAPLPEAGRVPTGPCTVEQIVRDGCHPATPGATLIRRSALERVRGFDEDIARAEDIDLWIRLASLGGRIVGVGDLVVRIRVHSDSLSAQFDVMAQQSAVVYERWYCTAAGAASAVRASALFYTRVALAAAYRQRGRREQWQAHLLEPLVEASPAWEVPEAFLRLAYLLLPHGWRAPSVLHARAGEIASGILDALAVLRTGPSHTRRRVVAAQVAVAQILTAAGARDQARRVLAETLRAWPGALRSPAVVAAVLRSTAPAGALRWVRSMRDSLRRAGAGEVRDA